MPVSWKQNLPACCLKYPSSPSPLSFNFLLSLYPTILCVCAHPRYGHETLAGTPPLETLCKLLWKTCTTVLFTKMFHHTHPDISLNLEIVLNMNWTHLKTHLPSRCQMTFVALRFCKRHELHPNVWFLYWICWLIQWDQWCLVLMRHPFRDLSYCCLPRSLCPSLCDFLYLLGVFLFFFTLRDTFLFACFHGLHLLCFSLPLCHHRLWETVCKATRLPLSTVYIS